ncbi:MAG: acyl carrier protein [Planctomycetes bacterium]|nr:acyl carrier protein [Planctomycetota bacterium]
MAVNDPWRPMAPTDPSRKILLAREAAGREHWSRYWPDDQPLLEARDRVSRLVRYAAATTARPIPNELFIPTDAIASVISYPGDSMDMVEIILEIENAFSIELDETITALWTYEQFLREIVTAIAGDFQRFDRRSLAPLAKPAEDRRTGIGLRLPWFGLASRERKELRDRQARRPDTWRRFWPDNQALLTARDTVSAIVVAHLGWFDDAFLPSDRLPALLSGSRRDRKRAATAIQRAFSLRTDLLPVLDQDLTYRDFLEWLLTTAET